MKPWWERFPGRLEDEITALEKTGAKITRDEKAFESGVLILDLDYPLSDQRVALRVVFPDFYPYFRVEIIAPALRLGRHQDPFLRHLCLIGRRTHHWRTDQLIADFLSERLPAVLEAGRQSADSEHAASIEEHTAEPVSAYFKYASDSFIAIDSAWQIPEDIRSGEFDLRYSIQGPALSWRVQGIVTKIYGSGRCLAAWDGPIPEGFKLAMKGRWVRVDKPIMEKEAGSFLKQLCSIHRGIEEPKFSRPDNKTLVDLIGVIFPEEVRYRTTGDGWIFVPRIKPAQKHKNISHAFYPALRAGRVDLGERLPAVMSLRERKVAIFGAGALGAPIALELARNGIGELRLIDPDIVEPGPTIRWPLGVAAYGLAKPEALRRFIEGNYPRTQVRPWNTRVGAFFGSNLDGPREITELSVMEKILDGIDLIVDTTTELGVHHFLSDAAREHKCHYVYAFATPGVWGGLVARFPAESSSCWMCLQCALYEDRTIPEPLADPTAEVQPVGCSEPTFIGASFDLAEVALETTRTVCGMLRASGPGYPDAAWDVALVALRDANGQRIPPTWTTHAIPQKLGCPCCDRGAVQAG